MTIVIMFRNGKELRMKCKKFTQKHNGMNTLTGYEFEGATENAIVWADLSEVLCIYRVMSDEVEG